MTYLGKDSLFLKLPTSEIPKEPTLLDLYTQLQTSNPNYDTLINLTYYLIKSPNLQPSQIIKLWLIRLTLHIFNNQLNYAQREAINLNNVLYLQEFPNATTMTIYPLAKKVDFNLSILLLRLKSRPDLTLVNDLYKLNYQLRLTNVVELQRKLINLSFNVMVVLLISKQYITLQSMLTNISCQLENTIYETYIEYKSQVILLSIIIDLKLYSTTDIIESKYSDTFSQITQSTKSTLLQVIPTLDINFTLSDLIKLDISNSVLISILAIWDICNTYPFKLIDNSLTYQSPEKEEEQEDLSSDWLVDLAYDELNKHWKENINKLYAIEL
ncbi:hypothetical protein JA1_000780 [Spathaspora sp. JA1]|nr:hypothetical protein JA1_000780 [Spathaspora sp. JA1]